MKLSEKGFHKVLQTCRFDEDRATYVLKYSDANKDYFFEVQGTEFKSDDFEDCVVLTSEQAKEIAWLIHAIKDSLCVWANRSDYDEYCHEAFALLAPKQAEK